MGRVGRVGRIGSVIRVGSVGEVGPVGAVGPVGEGPLGVLGPVGVLGSVGVLGPVGEVGLAGVAGLAGEVGVAGGGVVRLVGAVVGGVVAVGRVGPVAASPSVGAVGDVVGDVVGDAVGVVVVGLLRSARTLVERGSDVSSSALASSAVAAFAAPGSVASAVLSAPAALPEAAVPSEGAVAAATTRCTCPPARPPLIWANCSVGAGGGGGRCDAPGGAASTGGREGDRPRDPSGERSGARPASGGVSAVFVAAQAPANAAAASTTRPDSISARGRCGRRAWAPRGVRASTATTIAAAMIINSTASSTPHRCDIPPPRDHPHRAPRAPSSQTSPRRGPG